MTSPYDISFFAFKKAASVWTFCRRVLIALFYARLKTRGQRGRLMACSRSSQLIKTDPNLFAFQSEVMAFDKGVNRLGVIQAVVLVCIKTDDAERFV